MTTLCENLNSRQSTKIVRTSEPSLFVFQMFSLHFSPHRWTEIQTKARRKTEQTNSLIYASNKLLNLGNVVANNTFITENISNCVYLCEIIDNLLPKMGNKLISIRWKKKKTKEQQKNISQTSIKIIIVNKSEDRKCESFWTRWQHKQLIGIEIHCYCVVCTQFGCICVAVSSPNLGQCQTKT